MLGITTSSSSIGTISIFPAQQQGLLLFCGYNRKMPHAARCFQVSKIS